MKIPITFIQAFLFKQLPISSDIGPYSLQSEFFFSNNVLLVLNELRLPYCITVRPYVVTTIYCSSTIFVNIGHIMRIATIVMLMKY